MPAAVIWSLPFAWALLFWASFHPLALGPLAWASLVPLLLYAKVASGRKAFFVAWLGGALGYGASMFWVRFTYPRLREDQLQALAWKWLIPIALLNILARGVLKVAFT